MIRIGLGRETEMYVAVKNSIKNGDHQRELGVASYYFLGLPSQKQMAFYLTRPTIPHSL